MNMTLNQMAEAARALNGPLYADLPGDLAVSFEFFPPKTPAMQESLWQAVETLVPLAPRFFSVTYGAGGTTRERTHATVARIVGDTPVPAAAHLTCVNATAEELDVIADEYWAAGVRHIVALRGDPPNAPMGGGAQFQPVPGGHASAAELVAALKRRHDFEISVSCYPETHPEAASPQADLDALCAWDTPTICNALELVVPARRGHGYTVRIDAMLTPPRMGESVAVIASPQHLHWFDAATGHRVEP